MAELPEFRYSISQSDAVGLFDTDKPTPDDQDASFTQRDRELEDYINARVGDIQAASRAPLLGVRITLAQAVADASLTEVIEFDEADIDIATAGILLWDAGTPSRIAILKAGVISVAGGARFDSNAVGFREIYVDRNGDYAVTGEITGASAPNDAATEPRLSCSDFYPVEAGDFVELRAYQNSGGSLDVNAATLRVAYLGEQT